MNILQSNSLHFLLVVLFSCCLVESGVNYRLIDIPSLYNLCPLTNFCGSNATTKIVGDAIMPCCGYCSCERDCWRRGNCCPDKDKIIAEEPTEACETTLRSAGNTTDNGSRKPQYFVIKNCPRITDPLAHKCHGDLKSSFDDLVWVTIRRTNAIYNNKYCAVCHGVEDYSPWDIETNCAEAMNGQNSLSEVKKQVIDYCSVTVVPPKNENHKDNICMVPEITQCNVTGEWETYNQPQETACKSFKQIYVHEYRNGLRKLVYANPFCYLCNSPDDHSVGRLCSTETKLLSSGLPDFMGILDFTEIEKLTTIGANGGAVNEPVCEIDEVYDPLQRRCLKLSCPLLHAPVYGKCVKLVSSTRSLGVSAMLLIHPVWNRTNLNFDGTRKRQKNIAKSLMNSLLHGIGLPESKCKFCTNIIMVNYGKDGNPPAEMFPFFSLVKTNAGCSEDTIAERYYQLLGKEMQFQVGQAYMTLTVSAVSLEEFEHHTYYARPLYEKTEDGRCLKQVFDFQLFRQCPSVSLNYEDYLMLMKATSETCQKRDINSVFSLGRLDGQIGSRSENFTTKICVESYLSIIPKLNLGVLPRIGMMTILLCAMIPISFALKCN